MGSPPRTPREEEQRLNLRTLVIASAASATAALVTSRLWIAGTWIAAALTPVLVTFISELLRRPTERIARGITVDRPALPDPEAPAAGPEAAAARRVAERLRGEDLPLPDPEAPRATAPRSGAPPAPTHVYRSESALRTPRRRKIAYRVVLGTAALAFLIGAAVLTFGELVGGGSVGHNDRRVTLFGGSGKNGSTKDSQDPGQTTTDQTDTQTQPTTTTQEPTTPNTETTTTPTTTTAPPGEPAPTGTTPTTPAQP